MQGLTGRAALAAALVALLLPSLAGAAGGPLRLDMAKAVSIALERNTDLAIASMNRETARHRKAEALGMALPDLNLSANYTYHGNVQEVEFGGMSFQFQPDNEYAANASFSQYVYSGAVSAGYRASKHILSAAEKSADAARNDILTSVKTLMYEALFTMETIRAQEASVKQLRSHLADSKAREDVGLNTAYDTMRFETQLAVAEAELIGAKNGHNRAVAALLDSLGIDPLTPVEIIGELEYRPVRIALDDAVARARDLRPEIMAARENLLAAEEITSAARGELLPTVKAVGTYRYSNLGVGTGGESEWRNDWNAGLVLEYNLFDGRERASRVAQRRVEESVARLRTEKTARAAVLEVKTACEELARAEEFVESQNKSVGYAEETYRIASERLAEGVGTRLELLDAQLALTQAKINHSRSLYEHALSRVRLERAMGAVESEEN